MGLVSGGSGGSGSGGLVGSGFVPGGGSSVRSSKETGGF